MKCVITGGPGVGKTTLVEKLKDMGYYTIPEAARYVAEEEIRKGSTVIPRFKDKVREFQLKVLNAQLRFERDAPKDEIIFLDRGIPDGIAYFWLHEVEPCEEIIEAAKKHRYDLVFILEPLPIYRKDNVRWEEPEIAKKAQKLIEKAYRMLNYDVILVPAMSIEKRARFVIEKVNTILAKRAKQP
jgi:predicted ATPase